MKIDKFKEVHSHQACNSNPSCPGAKTNCAAFNISKKISCHFNASVQENPIYLVGRALGLKMVNNSSSQISFDSTHWMMKKICFTRSRLWQRSGYIIGKSLARSGDVQKKEPFLQIALPLDRSVPSKKRICALGFGMLWD